MPRTNNPLDIITGAGLSPPGSVIAITASLAAHVSSPSGAHPATAISTLDPFERYVMGHNVEGSLNELAALIPPPMGGVGSLGAPWLGSTNIGVPDWGILKLHDGYVAFTGYIAAKPVEVYPYYYRAPVGPTGVGVLPANGMGTVSDPTFNVFDAGFPLFTGGGVGLTHAGFATIPMGGAGNTGYPTWSILTSLNAPAFVVSGIASPGDRGVLALVRWPTGEDPTPVPAGTVADVQARCLAAVLLGCGILTSGCDGEPGGIFTESTGGLRAIGQFNYLTNPAAGYTLTLDLSPLMGGPSVPVVFTAVAGPPATPLEFTVGGGIVATSINLALAINTQFFPSLLVAEPTGAGVFLILKQVGTVGNTVMLSTTAAPVDILAVNPSGGTNVVASPYRFPGRAAGQYNLDEIHTGISVTAGTDPFFNPAAGQVRLLTDPRAVTFAPPHTVAGGLPIFGATSSGIGSGVTPPGFQFQLGGGTDGNFLAYRLPYLRDYTNPSGIVYTQVDEKDRFFTKLLPALGGAGTLAQAGDYDDFPTDFWAFQLTRYRHRHQITTAPPALRLDGNFALVHFTKEAYFEAYIRDGVVPTTGQTYSVNLVSWTGDTSPFAQLLNLTDSTTPSPMISEAYHVNRSEVVEDPNGTAALITVLAPKYKLDAIGAPSTMFSSGVEYYVPLDVTTLLPGDANVAITELTFQIQGLFDNGYRSHDKIPTLGPLAGDNRKYALNQNLSFVSLSAFSYEGNEDPVASTIVAGSPLFPAELGEIRRQRVEYGYADLTNPVTVSPLPGALADYNFVSAGPLNNGVHFLGDTNTPTFTRDGVVRMFFRRPLVIDGNGLTVPTPTTGYTVVRTTGSKVLYHSMREASDSVSVPYGNASNTALRGLSTDKDTVELFLDEVYRYPENWTPLVGVDQTQLQGPGLPAAPVAIPVPVRPTVVGNYDGWYLLNFHQSVLDNATANLDNALQVTGMPPRNPSYLEGLAAPFASRGCLMYPKTDYTVVYDPLGPDYSVLIGDRVFVRVLDAGASNAGASSLTLRLWGVQPSDFLFVAGGPGGIGLAIMVKIPGLTTWMDVGRGDGAGPSKQDVALDGAGCLASSGIVAVVDVTSQITYTDVVINLGPGPGILFLNGEIPARCPVAVKVIIKDNVVGRALDFVGGGETAPTASLRGLVGIEIL